MLSFIFITIFLCSVKLYSQTDSLRFRAYLFNKEYNVYMQINFCDNNIFIPGLDILGQIPGYLGKEGSSFVWPVIDVSINGNKATLKMVNDMGSEDLEATLTCNNDSVYTLRQERGSTLKVAGKGKWIRLPKELMFKRKDPIEARK